MNKTDAKNFNKLINDFAEGKSIQYLNSINQWVDCEVLDFTLSTSRYRIKPSGIWSKRYLSFDHSTSAYNINVAVAYDEDHLRYVNQVTKMQPYFVKWVDNVWMESLIESTITY